MDNHLPLIMTVQTMEIAPDGGALKEIHPNPKTGLYHDHPLMVLGEASRNGALYEESSTITALTNEQTRFGINVREGNQEGEWGHPFAKATDLQRMAFIERKNVSHFFHCINIKQIGNLKVVFADLGPTGPYGQYLRENFADPNRDVAFSLRAITQQIGQGNDIRRVKLMITFDAVDGPGFKISSKRKILESANENMNIPISVDDVMGLKDRRTLFATESITDQEILDIFQTSRVRITKQEFDCYDPKSKSLGSILCPDNRRVSAMHEMLRGGV